MARETPPARPQPGLRRLLGVAAYGAVTALVAYLISGGSVVWFLVVMVGFGVLLRLSARAVVLRRGERPPRWWWL
jgi:hypothetical protein